MCQAGTVALVTLASTTCRAGKAARGVTAMLWAPPMGSVTSAPGSVSVSLASLVSTVSAVRPTTLGLDLKAANLATVTTKDPFRSNVKMTAVANAGKASWAIAVTSVKRTISIIGLGLAAKSVRLVTGW